MLNNCACTKKNANESDNSDIHYYINPKYCDEEEEDDEDEFNQLNKNQTHSYNSDNRLDSSERHRNLNNKTRLGIRSNDNNHHHRDDDDLEGQTIDFFQENETWWRQMIL